MEERVAIISGAFGDTGSALCKRFAQEGFAVAALYNQTTPARAAEGIATLGEGNHSTFQCDFSDAASIERVVKNIGTHYGHIDVGIHAAWPKITRKKLLDTSAQEFDTQCTAGALGSFIFFQALGKIMQQQKGGVLIGITTTAISDNAVPGALGAYVPAKYALYGLLKTFAQELADSGVRVHAIAPGFMRAGMNKDLPLRLFELLEQRGPALPTPEKVAETAVRLVSESESAFSISVT